MGKALELAPIPTADPDRQRLADLVARREVLVGMIRPEKNRAGTTRDRWLSREIALSVRVLQHHLAAVEVQIATLVETREQLAEKAWRLRAVPGIRPAVAAVLRARLPELGHLEAWQIAALVGLAPHDCDSGLSRGKRHIWGGVPVSGAHSPSPRSSAAATTPPSRPSESGCGTPENPPSSP